MIVIMPGENKIGTEDKVTPPYIFSPAVQK